MDKKLIALLFIFFLAFTVFTGSALFQREFSRIIRATESTVPDPTKSIIIAWPLTVPADGQSQSKINVFVRNDKDSGLLNKKVRLTTTLGEIVPTVSISNKNGMTEFLLKSNTPGVAEVEAIVDENFKISSKVSILFSQ